MSGTAKLPSVIMSFSEKTNTNNENFCEFFEEIFAVKIFLPTQIEELNMVPQF